MLNKALSGLSSSSNQSYGRLGQKPIAQSRRSAADAVQEYGSSLAEQMIESAPPGAMPELEQVDIGTMFNMPRQNLYAAPQQLRYKAAGRVTKSGAGGSLTEAEVFNPAAAKALLVWKDAKGEIDPQNLTATTSLTGTTVLSWLTASSTAV